MRSARLIFIVSFFIVPLFIFISRVSSGTPQNSSPYAGTTLQDALRRMQIQGLRIIYSSDVIHPEMRVTSEPVNGSPRKVLDEILDSHGLKVITGPGNTLLVIRKPVDKVQVKKVPINAIELASPKEFVVVPFIAIDVTARNSDHRFVTNLKSTDFLLKEDGMDQPIVQFSSPSDSGSGDTDVPLTVLFLMDKSRSMNPTLEETGKLELVKQAVARLAKELRSGDQAMLMEFTEKSWVTVDMTKNLDALNGSLLDDTLLLGWSGILDALMQALPHLNGLSGKKIIILCSDGQDNASETTLDHLLSALQASDATILAIGPKLSGSVEERGRELLEKIAEKTGGYAFFPSDESEVDAVLKEAQKAMRKYYVLGYVPPRPYIRGWRNIEVHCKVPGIRVRYRTSYLF